MKRPYLKMPDDDVGLWRVQAALGAGVESDVYRVRHHVSGDIRSLKLLRGRISLSAAERVVAHYEMFRGISSVKQIRGWGVLSHQPGVGDRPYLIFDYVAGETLPACLARRTPKSPGALLLAVCETVASVHRAGLLIGDFDHGRNVLIERGTGRAVFCDLDCNLEGGTGLDRQVDLDELWDTCRLVYGACGRAPSPALHEAFDSSSSVNGLARRLRRLLGTSALPQAP